MSTTEETPLDPPASQSPVPAESPSKEETKPETAPESVSKDDVEDGHTPWDFLTVNPDTDATVKRESPERPLALLVNKSDEKVATENDTEDDKAIDKDARTFIEALDHLTEHKQDSYFYEQNRYGEQILFPEHALLDVGSEETVTPEGTHMICKGGGREGKNLIGGEGALELFIVKTNPLDSLSLKPSLSNQDTFTRSGRGSTVSVLIF
eukprot:sb/3470305/